MAGDTGCPLTTASGAPRAPRWTRDSWRLTGATAMSIPIAAVVAWALLAMYPAIPRYIILFVSTAVLWLVYAVIFLVWSWLAFRPFHGETLRDVTRASTPQTEHERLVQRLTLMDGVSLPLTGAVVGFIGVMALVLTPGMREDWIMVAAAFALITGSWLLMVVAFAVTYLREWAQSGGVHIPGDEDEHFSDFLYASIQVATTFATSDVETRTASARNWVTLNSIIAFGFNTVVIALFLSVATSSTL